MLLGCCFAALRTQQRSKASKQPTKKATKQAKQSTTQARKQSIKQASKKASKRPVFRTVVGYPPLLREALIFTIFCIPSIVKCSPRCIIITASLNNK
jgi:hypothetical protein